MAATLNKPSADPTMKDLLDYFKRDIMLSLNCHAIATVQTFDPTSQTISATINYTKTQMVKQADGSYAPAQITYPILVDCPAVIMGGGLGALTFPIVEGDQCLILFNDRDIDNWVAGANSGPVATPRLHSLSDGIALVGLNTVSNYDPARVVLRNGAGPAQVAVGATLIKIQNATENLNTILQNILTQLVTLANTPSVPGNPINPAVATALTALGLQLGGLLE